MTLRQAKWASQHDWWLSTSKIMTGWYSIRVADTMESTVVTFTDFDMLYAWAGY
jgi:hypothetical protein